MKTTLEYDAAEEPQEIYGIHHREKLDACISDYNALFGTSFSTRDSKSFYNYYIDIAKRVKNREIDVLLVVNMFLTGFYSKPLNTLYVDKNLIHHGLIQAFSRTNRILDKNKSHGNVVSFRNLKNATDEAIALFSNKNAKEDILLKPIEEYVEDFNEVLDQLKEITPSVASVDELISESDELMFVRAFRELMRIKNAMTCFADFSFDDLEFSEQEFEDYKSKYLDIYEKSKSGDAKKKATALDDVDFELELMQRDIINVDYILNLLGSLVDSHGASFEKKKLDLSKMLAGDLSLRSKKALIEKFIEENLVEIENAEDVPQAFETYWGKEKLKAFEYLCEEEELDQQKIEALLEEYLFVKNVPDMRDKVRSSMLKKESLLVRNKSIPRVIDKLMEFVNTFIEGIAA